MINNTDIDKHLKDTSGRFKWGILNKIQEISGHPYHRVANYMNNRKIANRDPQVQIEITEAAYKVIQQILQAEERTIDFNQVGRKEIIETFKRLNDRSPNIEVSYENGHEVNVLYLGKTKDIEILVDYASLVSHVKSMELNVEYDRYGRGSHTYDIAEWMEDNITEAVISYIASGNEFRIV